MADLKISQLTGATTPLAGTEVVPIVQGGSTKKVSVSNLTEGRTVRASRVGIGAGAPTYALDIINAETQLVSRMLNQETVGNSISTQIISAGNGAVVYQLDNDGLGSVFGQGVRGGTTTSSFYNLMTSGVDRLSIAAGGNVTINTGNVIVGIAGKGIDFSANANAPGMTSEVLDWYEEGVFTPTWGGSGGDPTCSYTSQTGRYTRIGDMVYCWVEIVTSAASGGSGNLQIKGLPFSARDAELNAGFASGFSANYPSGCFANSTTTVTMTGTVPGVEQAYLAIGTLGASSYLACRINYRVA